jgi:hypothetical protein
MGCKQHEQSSDLQYITILGMSLREIFGRNMDAVTGKFRIRYLVLVG